MKSLFILFGLLLHQTSLSATSNRTQITPKKIQFLDLNEDVLFMIFTNLPAENLLSVAQSTNKLSKLAAAAFHFRYRDYQIHILDAQENMPVKYLDNIYKKHLEIHDYKLTLDLLEYFGDSFKRLEICNQDMSEHHSNTINYLVNEFAADFVTHLDLQSMKRNTFEQFTLPFKEVRELTCLCILFEVGRNFMQFDKMFPKLESMTLFLRHQLDFGFMNHHMPHLKHLSINFHEGYPSKPQWRVDELLRKNVQIRNIALKVCFINSVCKKYSYKFWF